MCHQQVYTILSQYIPSIFGSAMAQKPCIREMNVTFLKLFFKFLTVLWQNKWHFWNPETKQGKIGMFLTANSDFQNLTFFDLNMIWPYIKCENECHHRILRPKWVKTRVVPQSCYILYGGFIWPDLDLDLYVALVSFLRAIPIPTNGQGKCEIVHHTISDFALNWYIGISMALISIFESTKCSLFRITRYSLSKFKLKVKLKFPLSR